MAKTGRAHLLETLSLFDDSLMEALLEEREVSAEKIIPLIREATLSQEVTPVMMGTAYKNKGVQELLDAIVAYLPSPLDRQVDATDLSKKANDVAKAAAPEGTKVPHWTASKVRLEAKPDAPAGVHGVQDGRRTVRPVDLRAALPGQTQ